MSDIQFTTVDRILAKSYRELKDTDLNEDDVIEWIGEALEFMRVPGLQEEAVAILEVNNYEVEVPKGFQMVLQLAQLDDTLHKDFHLPGIDMDDIPRIDATPIKEDSCEPKCLQPYFDMQMQYINWTASTYYKKFFRPIRLANNTLFNSIVCKEKDIYQKYDDCSEEYNIVGLMEKKFRFSFKEGIVALSYIKSAIDPESGYPLVPDRIEHITAISYYIKWKIAEHYSWNRKEGFDSLADKAEARWLKYVKQAKNYSKMPRTIDDLQDLLEQSHNMIPNHRKYYNYFGNLGRSQKVKFSDPDYRNK